MQCNCSQGDKHRSSVFLLRGHMTGRALDQTAMGLQSMLPHYLNRLGMEMSWAGRIGVILIVLNMIVLLITVVFRASPSAQQWAYATSVLALCLLGHR
jgi:hypothetical protein